MISCNDTNLHKYCDLLYEYNKKVRLTGAKVKSDIYNLIEDSLIPFKHIRLEDNTDFLDFGTGGGLPGIPLSICFRKINFFLLDSIAKKITAVNYFIRSLSLTNVFTVNERLENFDRNDFDYISSKGVMALPSLLELTASKLKHKGRLFFYQGRDCYSQLNNSIKIQKLMGLELIEVKNYLPDKYLVVFEKRFKTTIGFPRSFKKILKNPVI